VVLKSRPPFRGQRVAGLGAAPHFLGHGNKSEFVQRAQVRHQIAIAHLQFGLQFLERPTGPRSEQRHDGEPPLFVDDFVELLEIEHRSFDGRLFAGGAAFARPGADRVDDMIQAKGHAHDQIGNVIGKTLDRVGHHRNANAGKQERPS
jgi:hypothetical protein